TSEAVTGQLGDQLTITDYASNEYLFSVVLEDRPAPPQQTTLVCADWTAYFVDTAIPGTGLEEGYPGEHFAPAFAPGPMPEEYQRLRSHDAAFASFTLQVRGAFASFATSGHLDADGCVEVPSTALIYDEAAQPGSPNGGVALHMQMTSRFVRETSAGDVEFQVSGPVIALTTFGFNGFENGPHPFAVVDGL